jgi:predicted HTH transcriptional regulator
MKAWTINAVDLLSASLSSPRTELNEVDWKSALSPDKKRLAEHLSAFSNHCGGGYLVYGVDAFGEPQGVAQETVNSTVNQLANLGRNSVEPAIAIDHSVEQYEGLPLLFIHIPESTVKPVHLRGKPLDVAFIRSGGTTRRASRKEIGTMMLQSRTPRWEELRATTLLTDEEMLSLMHVLGMTTLADKVLPSTNPGIIDWLEGEKFIVREPIGGGYITNLGAISAARKLTDFPEISRKAIRVIVYDGLNKSKTKQESEGTRGYAVSFQNLLIFVASLLPQNEVIEQALRVRRTVYPEIALRELIANALIHQDFSIGGASP